MNQMMKMLRRRKMTLYNELVEDSKGIFHYINEIKPFEWNESVSPLELDIAYQYLNGARTVNSSTGSQFMTDGEEFTLRERANVALILFGRKWEQLYENFIADYPVTQSYDETIKELIDDKNERNFDRTKDSKVSAYDSEELVDDETDIVNESSNINNIHTRDYVRTGTNVRNIEQNIQRLQKEVLYEIVFQDVNSLLLLRVF